MFCRCLTWRQDIIKKTTGEIFRPHASDFLAGRVYRDHLKLLYLISDVDRCLHYSRPFSTIYLVAHCQQEVKAAFVSS